MVNILEPNHEEKDLLGYEQVKGCPNCGLINTTYLFFVEENNEINKECPTCGEIFNIFYDENKKIIKVENVGYSQKERELWLRKQKLEKLLL